MLGIETIDNLLVGPPFGGHVRKVWEGSATMNPTILIVEDDPSIRNIFKTYLAGEGYEVVTAESYGSALNIISSISLDTIISDVRLVESSGLDILGTVTDRKMICPVIMVTGYPDYELAAEAFRAGAFDYLVKPINCSALLRSVRNALRHKHEQKRCPGDRGDRANSS